MYSTAISSSVSALTTVLVKYEKKKNKILLWFSGIDGMGHCNINKWICFCQSVSPSYLSFVILYINTNEVVIYKNGGKELIGFLAAAARVRQLDQASISFF